MQKRQNNCLRLLFLLFMRFMWKEYVDMGEKILLNIIRCALGKSTDADINCRLLDGKQYKIV